MIKKCVQVYLPSKKSYKKDVTVRKQNGLLYLCKTVLLCGKQNRIIIPPSRGLYKYFLDHNALHCSMTFYEKIDIGKKNFLCPSPPDFLGTPGGRHNDVPTRFLSKWLPKTSLWFLHNICFSQLYLHFFFKF